MKALTVKPGKPYLAIACLFPIVAIFLYWGLSQAKPSENPVADQIVIVAFCTLLVLPGVVIALFYKVARLTIDDDGMVSVRLFRPIVRCAWEEVTEVELKQEARAFPIVIRSNGRKVAKISRAFDGYDQLLDLLIERGMLQENDLVQRAKMWVELDKMKLKDLFRRKK